MGYTVSPLTKKHFAKDTCCERGNPFYPIVCNWVSIWINYTLGQTLSVGALVNTKQKKKNWVSEELSFCFVLALFNVSFCYLFWFSFWFVGEERERKRGKDRWREGGSEGEEETMMVGAWEGVEEVWGGKTWSRYTLWKKLIKNPDESCLIDENVENTFEFNVIWKDFMNRNPMAQALK